MATEADVTLETDEPATKSRIKKTSQGYGGLQGILWQNIGSASAITLMGVMFWFQNAENSDRTNRIMEQSIIDRKTHREDMNLFRAERTTQIRETEAIHRESFGKMTATMEKLVSGNEMVIRAIERANGKVGEKPDGQAGNPGG